MSANISTNNKTQVKFANDHIVQIKHLGGLLAILYDDVPKFKEDVKVQNTKEFQGETWKVPRLNPRLENTIILVSKDLPQNEPNNLLPSWHWALQPIQVRDALDILIDSESIAITSSSVNSGASGPLNSHLQSIPETIIWQNQPYTLFDRLRKAEVSKNIPNKGSVQVGLLDYIPGVVVAKIWGPRDEVLKKVLKICLGYDHLQSMNLIFTKSSSMQIEVYCFPRRFDSKVIPTRNRAINWSFGAWELGGLFLVKLKDKENIYDLLSNQSLKESLQDVCVLEGTPEAKKFRNLLIYP